MSKAKIYCVIPKNGDGLDFYLNSNGESYYLFNQRYRDGVAKYFEAGVLLDKAVKGVKGTTYGGHIYDILGNIADRLPSYVRYIEKEYNLTILNRTKRGQALNA